MVKYKGIADFFGEIFNAQYFVSDLTVGAEIYIGIFTAGRPDILKLDLFKSTLSRGRLLGF